ncbi:hypothetical protein [Nostoc sp. CALU 546]|uniref:hypothetical protein n=1 Tax=Nostoc sp. CALU 546 TaxID=1867241 RepID=UPI003B6798F2
MSFVWSQWHKQHLSLAIFILLCLNVVTAPVVYAVANSTLKRSTAWAKELKN